MLESGNHRVSVDETLIIQVLVPSFHYHFSFGFRCFPALCDCGVYYFSCFLLFAKRGTKFVLLVV